MSSGANKLQRILPIAITMPLRRHPPVLPGYSPSAHRCGRLRTELARADGNKNVPQGINLRYVPLRRESENASILERHRKSREQLLRPTHRYWLTNSSAGTTLSETATSRPSWVRSASTRLLNGGVRPAPVITTLTVFPW